MATLGIMAQKKYVFIQYKNYEINIYGDVPSGIESKVDANSNTVLERTVMLINQLAERGFQVEQNLSVGGSTIILLSKNTSGSANAIQRVKADEEEEVTEVARYNLQGMPVTANEKGIQIIVYSNYTTKTVIVE